MYIVFVVAFCFHYETTIRFSMLFSFVLNKLLVFQHTIFLTTIRCERRRIPILSRIDRLVFAQTDV